MKFEILDKWISAAKDYHIPACLLVFTGGAVLQWFHHLDSSFVAFTGVVIGGITGHSFSPAGKPDSDPHPDQEQQPQPDQPQTEADANKS